MVAKATACNSKLPIRYGARTGSGPKFNSLTTSELLINKLVDYFVPKALPTQTPIPAPSNGLSTSEQRPMRWPQTDRRGRDQQRCFLARPISGAVHSTSCGLRSWLRADFAEVRFASLFSCLSLIFEYAATAAHRPTGFSHPARRGLLVCGQD